MNEPMLLKKLLNGEIIFLSELNRELKNNSKAASNGDGNITKRNNEVAQFRDLLKGQF